MVWSTTRDMDPGEVHLCQILHLYNGNNKNYLHHKVGVEINGTMPGKQSVWYVIKAWFTLAMTKCYCNKHLFKSYYKFIRERQLRAVSIP